MAMKYHTKPTYYNAVLPARRIWHQVCNELQPVRINSNYCQNCVAQQTTTTQAFQQGNIFQQQRFGPSQALT